MAQDQFGDEIAVQLPFAIAMGAFNASASVLYQGHRTGYNAAATLNQFFDIRPGTFAQQAAQAQRSIVSSNVNDTSAGTGARTVKVNYLNNSMVLKSETVTLNGTTSVDMTATDVQFIESMEVVTCGSGLANAGDISLKTTTGGGGSTMAQILAQSPNNSFYCHHYVPAGLTCFILQHSGSATAAVGRSVLYRYGDPRATAPTIQIGDIFNHVAGGSWDHQYETPLVVTGPDLILAREIPVASAAGNIAYAGFDFVEFAIP